MGPLLEQIAALLKLAQDHAGTEITKEPDPIIQTRLETLREMVENFKQITLSGLADAGVNPSEASKKMLENPHQLKNQDQKIIKRTLQLGFDALIMKSALQSASAMGKLSKDFRKELSNKKASKKTVKNRKKKFKRMGGDSKWVPL